jgi:hypothetical protein
VAITPRDKLPLLNRFARLITRSCESIIERSVQTGSNLIAFGKTFDPIWKQSAEHGRKEFLMHCRLHKSTATKCTTIARNAILCNRTNWPKLPRGLENLYELAKEFEGYDHELEALIADGTISQKTTLEQIKELRQGNGKKKQRRRSGGEYRSTIRIPVPPDRDQFVQKAKSLEGQIDLLLNTFAEADFKSNIDRLN